MTVNETVKKCQYNTRKMKCHYKMIKNGKPTKHECACCLLTEMAKSVVFIHNQQLTKWTYNGNMYDTFALYELARGIGWTIEAFRSWQEKNDVNIINMPDLNEIMQQLQETIDPKKAEMYRV